MQAEFIPLTEREHGADHGHPAGAVVEMRPGPDLAPGVARDQVDEFGVERVLVGDRFVDPGIRAPCVAAPCRHRCVVDRPWWVSPVIASAAKQSSSPRKERMDCFVASLLAMTAATVASGNRRSCR